MQQLRRSTVSRALSILLVTALLTPQCVVYLSGVSAQEAGTNVPAVAVIPFQDVTGKGSPALMREATAAAALALEDSKEYVVTSTADFDREMAALRLTPPLSLGQQLRLGERLHVEKILVGTLSELGVDSRTGRARVGLRLMMLDVEIGEYLDGSIIDIETKTIPGFNGDVAQVMHEALREAAEAGIGRMLSASVRRGTVEMVDDLGNVNINLGTNDGVEVGSDLLVMRPTWQPDAEKVILRRVGVIRIAEIESNMSVARGVDGGLPTSGDKVYRVYKPHAVMQAEAKSRKLKSTGQLVAGLLLVLGLVAVATGDTTSTVSGVKCSMLQTAPGQSPYVRLAISTPSTAKDATHGYLIFRAANNPDFSAVAGYLIDMIQGYTTRYTDDPLRNDTTDDEELTFQYEDATSDGELTDGSVTATYNHLAMVPGTRYFYKVRRITDPLSDPGTNPPISTAQTTVTPVITPDPDWSVITDASASCGPLTYYTVPLQSSPADAAANLTTTSITFTWQATTGANEYRVEVYPATDPDGTSAASFQSAVIRDSGSSVLSATISGPFSASTTYYWRVGARQSSDTSQPVNEQTGKSGWLYSTMRSFTTAASPPTPPGTSSAGGRPIPNRHGGWWGNGRR